MAIRNFEAALRRESGMVIIDLSGEIDAAAEPGLDKVYEAAEKEMPSAIILNFRDVDYINSTGIALIVGLLARARKTRCPLKAFGLSDHYTELFNITRLSDFMSIFPDEPTAIVGSSPTTL
jgi:anti-anti-sigma factor